jgi:hypothetical protein
MSDESVGFDLGGPATVSEHPFRHVCFAEASGLAVSEVERLIEVFPADGAVAGSRRTAGGSKTYSVRTVTVHHAGRWTSVLDELHPRWRDFLGQLVESDYRHRLATLLGIPPGPVELELRLAEYPRGGWMSRHTDRPDKLFSQNIYLCPGWRPEWGGGLALYGDEHAQDPVALFVPGAGNSLAFARSDRSWHEVLPVSPRAPIPRRTVLVHGYRDVPTPQRSDGRTDR